MGFEPTISAVERPQAYALDRAATGTGKSIHYMNIFTDPLGSAEHTCGTSGLEDSAAAAAAAASVNSTSTAAVASVTSSICEFYENGRWNICWE